MNVRVFSEWTDNLLCCPFTIFSFANKSGVNKDSECIVALKMLRKVADSMRSNGNLLKRVELAVKVSNRLKEPMDVRKRIS